MNGTEVCREGRQVCNSVLTISCQVARIYACSSLYLLCILMLSVSIITLCALSRLFVQLRTMIAISRQAKALSSEDIWNITIYAYFAKSQFSCSTYLVLFFLPLGLSMSNLERCGFIEFPNPTAPHASTSHFSLAFFCSHVLVPTPNFSMQSSYSQS